MVEDDRDKTREQLVDELRALRAETADLRKRIVSLEDVIEVIDDAVFVKDGLGRYLMINTAGARLLGKPVEEILGKDDTELFSPETARQIIERDREVIADGMTRTFEEVATSAGGTRTYWVTKGPSQDDRGCAIGVIGISRDITARKRAEEELRETKEFLTRLLDHAPAPIYVTCCDGRIRLVNRAWEEMFGMRREDVLGGPVERIFPHDEAHRFLEQNQRVIRASASLEFEEEVPGASNGPRALHTVKFPLRNLADQIDAVGGISFDVTRSKRAEELLRKSQRRMQALFDNALDAIWLLDDEGRFVDANPAVCSLLGYSREEFLRMSVADVTPARSRELVGDLWRTFLAEGHLSGEFTQICKDGSTREVDYRAVAHILPGIHLSVNRDITTRKRAELDLREREEQVRLLLDSTGEAIFGIDLDGCCTLSNAACLRLLGYGHPRELLGKHMHRLIHHTRLDGTSYPVESCPIYRAYLQGEGVHIEDEVLWRADGTNFPVEYWSYPVRRVQEVVGAVVTFVDISERKRVEEELRALNAALENAVEGISLIDAQGRYLTVNRAAAALHGYLPEELVGTSWQAILHPTSLEKAMASYQRMLDEGRAEVEVLAVRKDGSTFWRQDVKVRAHDQHEKWVGHYSFTKDVTERKGAQVALSDYADRLQVLSRRVVEVQEEERRHLARELHDEIGQTLTAIGINLQSIGRSCGAAVLPRLEECIGVVNGAIQQVRRLSLDLRPPMLDDLGLVAALRWYVDCQSRRVGYRARFASDPDEIRLDSAVAIAAFRVAQEALTNVARHADARRVKVTVHRRETTLLLTVRDDGAGFDPEATLRRGAKGETFGLLGMRERAALLGGSLVIRSAPGKGTKVRMRVPLSQVRESA
jgi:PAS domain S-box-containing protein